MPPVLYGRYLLIPTDDSMLKAVDTGNGRLLWKIPVGDAIRIPPSVVDGKIYVVNGNKQLLELRMRDGKVLRKKPIYSRPTGPLSKIGKVLILPVRERGAFVIVPETLELDGFFAKGWTSEVPVIGLGGSRLILATNRGTLLGFRLR
jgi:outer membrane protein assembly factor BamB